MAEQVLDRSREPARPHDRESDEAFLVARARRDRRAFEPLDARYFEPIYRYCYRRLGSHDAAEETTSQVFAKALDALPRYEERGRSFRAWLFAIAHNVIVDGYRARRPPAPLAEAVDIVDATPTPEEHALAAEDRRSLRALLDHLPADQRRVVELRLAGLSGAEIADALGRSVGAVKSTQFRAYARLRRLMGVESERGRNAGGR